ncbi:hypothetical protein VM98_35605 [Streptomyces rubellomurinus subsp. indigoferus]|nr:hypothetical protein VM98_35605 [Streptomyces rubellomurinus subsp. indigoferus]
MDVALVHPDADGELLALGERGAGGGLEAGQVTEGDPGGERRLRVRDLVGAGADPFVGLIVLAPAAQEGLWARARRRIAAVDPEIA